MKAPRIVLGFMAVFQAAACGGTIGQFDSLPAIPVDQNAPWPRLVDTPEPPEARLTAGTGKAALSQLTDQRMTSAERSEAVRATPSVPDTLRERVSVADSRRSVPAPPVDAAALSLRADEARRRADTAGEPVNSEALIAFAETQRNRKSAAGTAFQDAPAAVPSGNRALGPAVSPDFEDAARRALDRAAKARNLRP